MSAKSDFAQKLLSDLRMRKERMAAAQNSSRQSTQTTSRAVHGNKGQSTSTRSRQTNRSKTKPINTRESSNQMILYESSQKSSQLKIGDLSMAIAFAFESNGNLTTIGASTTNNPLANFFNRFNRRSRDTHKTEITTFGNRGQLPTVSNIHITEVSKGVQKLNQILRACSNGFSLDGKELLKGAIDLEESLRMLVELQEGSQYGIDTQKNKSRLRLIDDDDDDEEENVKIAEQWKLDRPKFSFDKHRVSGAKVEAHKRSSSYGQDLSLSSSSQSVQSQKKGISNVVAKLMGLEEIQHQEDFRFTKNDPKGKVKKQSSDFSEALSRESNKRAIQVNENQVLNVSQRKQDSAVDQRSTMQVSLNTELQRKGQNSKTTKATECKTHDRVRQKFGVNSIDREVTRNQQKHEEKVVPKRGGHSEDVKVHNEKKDQHTQRQISKAKNQESLQVKPIIPAKPKKSTVVKKKSTREESAHGNVKSTKAIEEAPTKDQKSKIHQVEVPTNDEQVQEVSAREPQLDMDNEKIKPKDKPSEVSLKQNQVPIIPRKVQRSEIPQKIDVLMSRRNANHLTRPKKQPADSSNMLKDLKQRLHSKNSFTKRTEEQRQDNKLVEDERAEVVNNAPENTKQEMLQNADENRVIQKNTSIAEEHQTQNLQNTSTPQSNSDDITLISRKVEHHQNTLEDKQELKQCDQLYTSIAEEHQTQNLQKTSFPEDHSDPNTLEDEQELKQFNQLYTRKKQLTEHETKLKEIMIKSQTLLSTADALFKLNIPVSLLHTALEQQEYYESTENKLVLDCTNEVMRRKARRFKDKGTCDNPKLQSLDDLIRKVSADLETLESYGGEGGDDVATLLHRMVERDVDHRDVDVNCMWEFEWSNVKSFGEEKESVVTEVERWVFNSLVDEFTKDLDLIS